MLKYKNEAGLNQTQFEKTQQLQGLFAGWIGNGMTAALAQQNQVRGKEDDQSKKKQSRSNSSELESIQNVFFETMAMNIAKDAPSSIPLKQKHELADLFGTDTKVFLPKRDVPIFDTKTINQGGKHASNNRLATNAANQSITPPIRPGMKSRLHIDYSKPHTAEFQQAIADVAKNSGGAGLRKIPETVEIDSGEDDSQSISIITPFVEKKKESKLKVEGNKGIGACFARAWQRMKRKNRSDIQAVKKENELSDHDVHKRKRAKKIAKSVIQFRIVEKLKHPHKTTKFIRTHQYTTYVENTYNLQNLKQLLINLQTTN